MPSGTSNARLRQCTVGLLLLSGMLVPALLAGCGSTTTPPQQSAARERSAAQRRQALAVHQQKIRAEVSDMNPRMTCRDWLRVSPDARNLYLGENWPRLPLEQRPTVVRQQNLGCEAAPPPGTHTPMGSLQAAVDLVVWKFQKLYEGTIAEGQKQSVEGFAEEIMGMLKMAPARPRPHQRHRRKD